jgi:hypothetical protein
MQEKILLQIPRLKPWAKEKTVKHKHSPQFQLWDERKRKNWNIHNSEQLKN